MLLEFPKASDAAEVNRVVFPRIMAHFLAKERSLKKSTCIFPGLPESCSGPESDLVCTGELR
jgi:hypothetical protein